MDTHDLPFTRSSYVQQFFGGGTIAFHEFFPESLDIHTRWSIKNDAQGTLLMVLYQQDHRLGEIRIRQTWRSD
jgi:hypothetical protein